MNLKKLIFPIGLVFIFCLAFSCKKDEETPEPQPSSYAMTFTPYFNGEEVEIGSHYTNADGYPFDLTDIRFYLSDIRLIKHSGEEVPLSEIEFFSVQAHKTSMSFEIPTGSYDSIAFNLGVPADLNSPENPDFLISAFSASHPLSESNGMYWIWESGYRFFTIEGHCDTVPNTAEALPLPFSFHTGRDTLYRKIPTFYHPFTVGEGSTVLNAFAIDLSTFFTNGDAHIDLAEERSYHGSLAQMGLGIKLADNSAASFQLLN